MENEREPDTTRTGNAAVWCLAIALACQTAWVSMAFKSLTMYGDDAESIPVLNDVYFVSLSALVITLIACAIFHRRFAALFSSSTFIVVVALLTAASTAVLPLASQPSEYQTLVITTAGLLSGIASALYLTCLGVSFARSPTRVVIIAASWGVSLSILLIAGFLVLPVIASAVFCVGASLVGAALLIIFNTVMQRHGLLLPRAPEPRIIDSETKDNHDLTIMLTRFSLCACAVGLANECLRLFCARITPDFGGREVYNWSYAVIAFVVTIIAILFVLSLSKNQGPHLAKQTYRFTVLLLVLGIILVPLPLIVPEMSTMIPHALNTASYQCFSIIAWIIIVAMCKRYPHRTVFTFCLFRAAWAVGPFLGVLITDFITARYGMTIEASVFLLIITIPVLLIGIGGAFSESEAMAAIDIIPSDRRRRFVDRCNEISERYGLSARETEVLTLFAKGYNISYVEDTLCLSRSTVSTHRQHIYQKLGVHSQTEMLELIQSRD